MKKFTTLILLLPAIASAASWEVVAHNPSGYMAVSPETIVAAGKYRKAWVRTDYSTSPSDLSPFEYLSSKTLYIVSCAERAMAPKQRIVYSGRGGFGNSKMAADLDFRELRFSDVPPDSLGEAVFDFICAKSLKPASQNPADFKS